MTPAGPRRPYPFDDDRRPSVRAWPSSIIDRNARGARILTDPDRSDAAEPERARSSRPAGIDRAPAPPREEGHRLVGRDQGDLLADPRRARLPQLHRQALLHPVRIDDAGPAGRRPAGGQQISLWLVLGLARASTSCRTAQGRLWGALPERGDVVIVTPPGQSSRLYQARHRPARRHDRADRRHRLSQRQARCRARSGRRR